MNFASLQYIIFIAVVFLVYWNSKKRYQNLILLAASYLFYARLDWRFVILILIPTVVDYVSGIRIFSSQPGTRKKIWLGISLAVNLCVLGYFKYFNFFSESFSQLIQSIGLEPSFTTLKIILPVGISYYTFRSMSYTIDIYRGKLQPTNSIIRYATFVSFFPHLTAGPITRAKELIPQLDRERRFNGADLQEGVLIFLRGFFKKVFIADTLAMHLVNPVFSDVSAYSTGALWLAMLGYTVQIYADFSGYTNMAIGSARVLGLNLPENFRFPYLARNISEFWRTWHITMSQFFRDYVYITLGGNRRGLTRTLANLSVTTLLSGLWHGAGLTFIVWGALHGIYISIYHLWKTWRDSSGGARHSYGLAGVIIAWALTQTLVSVTWIAFRAPDIATAWVYMKGLAGSVATGSVEMPLLAWAAFGFFIIDHLSGWTERYRARTLDQLPHYLQAAVYAAMIIFLYHARPEVANPFIYFKF